MDCSGVSNGIQLNAIYVVQCEKIWYQVSTVSPFVIAKLENLASLPIYGGKLTLTTMFDTKCSCLTSPSTRHHNLFRTKPFNTMQGYAI